MSMICAVCIELDISYPQNSVTLVEGTAVCFEHVKAFVASKQKRKDEENAFWLRILQTGD